jgi:predicted Kef-type K+ transport protein
MGVELKVLPGQGQSYIVAGALLSIALNSLWFALLGRARAAPPECVAL